jgi:hypothetical protein
MLAIIPMAIALIYMLLWLRAMRRMYKTIQTLEGFTAQEKVILTRQVIVLSPAIIAFVLMMGKLSFPYLVFFDSGAVLNVIVLILSPILLYIGSTGIKYHVMPSKEPVRGKMPVIAGVIAIGGVVLLIQFVISLNFS